MLPHLVLAQNLKADASVSKTNPAEGEQFRLTFTINANGASFTPPDLSKFRVYSGPNQSSSMQWINGKSSSSLSVSYVLAPVSAGKQVIGAGIFVVNGTKVSSSPITLQVQKGQAQNQQNQNQQKANKQQQQQQQQNAGGSLNLKDNIFIRLEVSRNKAFVNQQIIATYKIYTRLNIVSNNLSKFPSFEGFTSQDIELPKNATLQQEVLNGIAYNSAILKQSVLFPQKSGELIIDDMHMDVVIRVRDNKSQRSIFDSFFGGYRDINYHIESNAAKIQVEALLKAGKPSNFSGAVGQFKLSSKLDKDIVAANDAVNYTIEISGTGNLDMIDKLPIEFPADFEVYDPKITSKLSTTTSGMSGKKIFEYLLIPRHGGEFSIPSSLLFYFDPKEKVYKSLETSAYNLTVERAENESIESYAPINKENIKFVGKDIRYIKNLDAPIENKNQLFFGSRLFYFLLSAPLLGIFIFFFVYRNLKKQGKNLKQILARKARREADKRFREAEKYLASGESDKYFEAIYTALQQFLKNKLYINTAELTKQKVLENLMSKGIDENTSKELYAVLETCEMSRFSPMSSSEKDKLLIDAKRVVSTVENSVK